MICNSIPQSSMTYHHVKRMIHTCCSQWSSSTTVLATLRKRTGYAISNCKKALEVTNNNVEEAEKWLRKEAQAMGWAKATKLEGRRAVQGLVAVVVDKNNAAMVEVNCETDFVARNKIFQSMVQSVASSCLQFVSSHASRNTLTKLNLSSEQLKSLPGDNGVSLADQVAATVGNIGENMILRRAACLKAGENMILSGYTHPAPATAVMPLLGKYGAILVLTQNSPLERLDDSLSLEQLGRQLCQHVVGMNPQKIGDEDDKPAEDPELETCLIHQEYLLEPSQTVGQLLSDAGASVIGFTRFECGEELE